MCIDAGAMQVPPFERWGAGEPGDFPSISRIAVVVAVHGGRLRGRAGALSSP